MSRPQNAPSFRTPVVEAVDASLSRFLVALGDTARQQILLVLSRERLNVGALTERFTLSRPAVSHHLRVLSDAGLLQVHRQGRERLYVVDAERCRLMVGRLAAFIEQCCPPGECCTAADGSPNSE